MVKCTFISSTGLKVYYQGFLITNLTNDYNLTTKSWDLNIYHNSAYYCKS